MASLERVFIELPDNEAEIIQAVIAAESFRKTCWQQYKEDWVNHIPQAINAFMLWYFGTQLLPWQLAIYYSPHPEITLHGGRGAGKTRGVALAMAAYHTLHPGEPWIHVSPVKDQAARTSEAILLFGNQALGHPNFFDRFVKDFVAAPFPEIRLKSWGEEDPGNIFRFRPLGDDNIEYLRSMEAGTITVDEAFREVPNPDTYPQLRGCIRGINTVKKAMLPKDIQNEIDDLLGNIPIELNNRRKQRMERKLNSLYYEHDLLRRNLMCLYGNVGPWDWEWDRYAMAESDPQHWFSMTVTTYDNPHLSEKSIEDQRRSYGTNDTLLETEMLARRPVNLGGIFVSIGENIDNDAIKEAEKLQGRGEAIVKRQAPYGIYHYALPPDETHFYVVGADPGSGIAPGRNKWVIVAYDLTSRPVKLVYFRMGHTMYSRKGDITAFWTELQYVSNTYPHYPGDVWIESSGTQKGQAQLAMPTDITINPISFTGTKIELINQLRMLLDRHMLSLPNIPIFIMEHGNYNLPDDKLTQDCVMANICAAGAMWRYIDFNYDMRNMGSPNAKQYIEKVPKPDRYNRPNARHEPVVSRYVEHL